MADINRNNRHVYRLNLSPDELTTLGWLVNHGYYPEEAWKEMYQEDEDTDEWLIPEWAAWSITDHEREDPGSFLACCGEPLLGKLIELWQEIV